MSFSFKSSTSSAATLESLWDFTIVGHDITVPFLLVAHVAQPDVQLDQSNLNFGHVLVGWLVF